MPTAPARHPTPAAGVKHDTLTGVVANLLGPGSRLATHVIRTGRYSPNPWPPAEVVPSRTPLGAPVMPRPHATHSLHRVEDLMFEATAAGGLREPATSLSLSVARKKKRQALVGSRLRACR